MLTILAYGSKAMHYLRIPNVFQNNFKRNRDTTAAWNKKRNGLNAKLRCNGRTAVRPVLTRLDYTVCPDDLDMQISTMNVYHLFKEFKLCIRNFYETGLMYICKIYYFWNCLILLMININRAKFNKII